MLNNHHEVVNFIVCSPKPGISSVFEVGFEQPIAEFTDVDTAEQYALRVAEIKSNWKVDVYDEKGALIGTYNSEDDAMPKPTIN
jgi:hypothetical protein